MDAKQSSGSGNNHQQRKFEIGEWRVDPVQGRIFRGDEIVTIQARAMDVLVYLAQNAPEPVLVSELIEEIWSPRIVGDENVKVTVNLLRKALGDDARYPVYIETIPKRGYRLIAPVSRLVDKTDSRDMLAYPVDHRPSIAVLPFVNMSDDATNEYFSDGISEEILNTLVKTNTLPVIARTSSFQFKNRNLNIQQIAAELGVTHVLEGSVRKAGDDIRITAQLADAETGIHLWSEHYDRQLQDIFAVQDEIAAMIVDQIVVALPGSKKTSFNQEAVGTSSLAAYELYLQANQKANTGNPFEVEKAIPLYEMAIELDQDFVDAWMELGYTYMRLTVMPLALKIPVDVYPIAIRAMKKVLKIDPRNSRAIGTLGILYVLHEYQWNKGIKLLEQSVAINKQDSRILGFYGLILTLIGHPDGTSFSDRAYLLDPFDVYTVVFRAVEMINEGQFVDATVLMETRLVSNREKYDANSLAAQFNINLQRFDKAEEYLSKAREVVGADYNNNKRLDYNLARGLGKKAIAEEIRADLLNSMKQSRVCRLWELAEAEEEDTKYYEIIDVSIKQRHPETLNYLLAEKPPRVTDSAWARIQKEIRVAEAKVQSIRNKWYRSKEEKTLLKSREISLSIHELDFFIGEYEDPVNLVQLLIQREGKQLYLTNVDGKTRLIPVETNQFHSLEVPISYDFIVEDNHITRLRQQRFQATAVFLKKA
jgi:TolB-like protein/Tfp pilus assembly protein PilF